MTKLKRLRSENSRGLYCKVTPALIKKMKTLHLLGKSTLTVKLPTYFNPYKASAKGINVIKVDSPWGKSGYRKMRGRCAIGWKEGTKHGDLHEWTLWIESELPF